ncbi:hypothetical protein BLNAU_12127 [Blattamonas nauphoetae]|uniref:Uncharacterized protein n=1 Tax=Blattamonas nauphoetae TaxID=2049346 RepID=A0ABQ9XLM7_9EUKA|nr:hypothetical protein BLNAU_12127 [Blattamonas nauphoetae]
MRQIETEREKEKGEFARKMREMGEMKRMNEELIEEGRQRREEKKREDETKREEEECRRMNQKGAVVIEVKKCINYSPVGLIAADLFEQAVSQTFFSNLKRAASWILHPGHRSARQNGKDSHIGSACKAVADGQRVVMEADGREGKRTLKLSQDGETQPVFFSNIPVPFRFGIQIFRMDASVEIVSSEVLKEASMVGGSLEVVID